MGRYLGYGFLSSLISTIGIFIVTDIQGIDLPIWYYLGFVLIFTPFIAWLRKKEMERKKKIRTNKQEWEPSVKTAPIFPLSETFCIFATHSSNPHYI